MLQRQSIATTESPALDPGQALHSDILILLQFHKQLKQLVSRAATHPKMAALLEVVLEHFGAEGSTEAVLQPAASASAAAAAGQEGGVVTPGKPGGEGATACSPGRVIVFTNRRDSVQSIVEMLRNHEPLVTARYKAGSTMVGCY